MIIHECNFYSRHIIQTISVAPRIGQSMVFDTMVEKHQIEDEPAVLSPDQITGSVDESSRKDISKEEQDVGLPSESDAEAEKPEGDFEGWDSQDDPDNPKNWSFGKKVFHTAIPALYGFVM